MQKAGLAFFVASLFLIHSAHAFYGAVTTQAQLKFSSRVEFRVRGEATKKRIAALADRAIRTQLDFLHGGLRADSLQKKFPHLGAPARDLGLSPKVGSIQAKDATLVPGKTDRYQVQYAFEDAIILQSDAFGESKTRSDIPIVLPISPELIYKQTFDKRTKSNPCTDANSNSSDMIFYYWNPDAEKCPLRGKTDKVIRTQGIIERIDNTRETYPEYDQLYLSKESGKVRKLVISVFLGYIDKVEDPTRPLRSDSAFESFRKLIRLLRSQKYKLTECDDRFTTDTDGFITSESGRGSDSFRVYEKTIEAMGQPLNVQVRVLLSNARYSSPIGTFHYHYLDALANSDIIYFDGHSGLGDALSLKKLRKDYGAENVQFKESYQILFFNACSSTSYFVPTYMAAKKDGTKSLDMITPAIPSFAASSLQNTVTFLTPFLRGEMPSWQKILDQLEESNYLPSELEEDAIEGDTYLFSVSGDEDNLWRP